MAAHYMTSTIFFFLMILLAKEGHSSRHEGHTHHRPNVDVSGNILKDTDFVRDYEHIKEDLQDMYNKDFSDNLDDTELEVYYFQLHDLDTNGLLDGLELLAAINHIWDRDGVEIPKKYYEENESTSLTIQRWWNDKFQEDAEMIDQILEEEDLNHDGFLSYIEFIRGRGRESTV